MSPAAKLDILVELYERGLLCKCNKTMLVEGEDVITGQRIWTEKLVHKKICQGKIKLKELMNATTT